MLAVTQAAADAITSLTAGDGEAGNGGLRFSVHEEHEAGASLAMEVANAPQEGDAVVTAEPNANVYLEPKAAAYLEDKLLDVQPDDQGQLSFSLRDNKV
ncbi:Fe-S cluster assembly iron-binding protein IscA [Herbihabitans rhizosphaerae]|uniref:Fe-S cluster assembly iron-binding protein IscA n=1 Tax=Herbihabitans rhizosphaerae TaxID=1872711 RepID=A0A4Q7L3J8_9PSEU|nr:iron-sulfur cluster biosynthesis family protein [Herbihabitans rhizosphaerae]RZS43031.1 Fe-S cluster assembly iron-binding protein IscA [Herbihabitans rhizosphaerae]